jgi:hypothetical protein
MDDAQNYGVEILRVLRIEETGEIWFEAIGRIKLNYSMGTEFHLLLNTDEVEALMPILRNIRDRFCHSIQTWTPGP